MPVIHLEDGSGETLRVFEVDGFYAPTFDLVLQNQEEDFRSIRDWKVKEDDIFICAYPKSGTHWLWEVTSMVVNQSADRVRLIKETAMLEGITGQMFDNVASPRVLNTHLPIHLMPTDVISAKCKLIFVQRNPKDVCVSFFHHHSKIHEYEYEGKFENYFGRYLKGLVDYGSWFDYTLEWEQLITANPHHPIHVMSFEDMKTDPIKEIGRLSAFLGLKSEASLVSEIAEKCDFRTMKKEKDPLENKADWKGGEPGMYRKGQVGDWKNHFTVAQNEQFDAVFNDKMKNSRFTYRFC